MEIKPGAFVRFPARMHFTAGIGRVLRIVKDEVLVRWISDSENDESLYFKDDELEVVSAEPKAARAAKKKSNP